MCVPNGQQFEVTHRTLAADPDFTVVRASITCGTHACVAVPGNSFGLAEGGATAGSIMSDHLSSYTPLKPIAQRVRDEIFEKSSVWVQTSHPRHRS